MSQVLEIRPATDADRAQIYRNSYEMWGRPGMSLEEHIQWRMNCPQHNRGQFFAGNCGDRLVASLIVYPLKFALKERVVAGMGIGSVYTVSEYRGRGFAVQMLNHVEQLQREAGTLVSLLYSDIDPGYYARLGYLTCASWEGWITASEVSIEPGKDAGTLVAFTPKSALSDMRNLYERSHAQRLISIDRDEAYWDYLLQKEPSDTFYWLENAAGERLGYVRLNQSEEAFLVSDCAFVEQSDAIHRMMFQSIVETAQRQRVSKIGGWLPESAVVRSIFRLKHRDKEISMLKSLDPNVVLQADTLNDAQHFQEIDHF